MAEQIATGVQWVVDDSTGAITGYRRKINGVDTQFSAPLQSPVSVGGSVAPGIAAAQSIQAAVNSLDAVTLYSGAYLADETVLIGSNTVVSMAPGTTLTSSGTYQHTMFRTGNAEFSAATGNIPGISIYCAEEVTASGTGTLRYTHSGTTLAWKAPGDTSFGSEVSIAAVVSVATSAVFIVASANGAQIMVYVTTAAARNANISRTVRVEPVTGAKSVTWTRASNVRTVTEAAHGRKVGDFVIHFGPSADVSHGFITAVTVDTYTFQDAGASQAVAQAGMAFGVRNIHIRGNGARLNYNKPNLATALMSNLHAIIFLACSDCSVTDVGVDNATKYAIFATGVKNFRFSGISSYRDVSATTSGNSDTVHITGPAIGIAGRDIRAQGGDNIIGIGCCDYADYNWHLPGYGTVDIVIDEIANIRGEDTNQQPVRLYNANSGVITGGRIGPVTGTYSTSADSAVAVISDNSVLQVDAGATNVNGLVVISPDAVRSDASVSSAFISRGAGTRRGFRVEQLRPRSFSNFAIGSVLVEDSTLEDLYVEAYGAGTFSGAVVLIIGTGRIKYLTGVARSLVWDNSLGGGQKGAFVGLNNASAIANFIDVRGTFADSSASGSKASIVFLNNGTIGRTSVHDFRGESGMDSVLSVTTGTPGYVHMSNFEFEGSYLLATSAGMNGMDFTSGYHYGSASAAVQWNVPGAGTVRVRAHGLRCSNRFLRNITGNSVFLLDCIGSELTSNVFVVDAGTPSLRMQGPTDISMDGALIDATATNHAPGASFYNTNAAFGAGVGAYVRGATTWTRVAA